MTQSTESKQCTGPERERAAGKPDAPPTNTGGAGSGGGTAGKLLPQHWEDLKRSGLSHTQINACAIHSVTDPKEAQRLLGWKGPAAEIVPALCFHFRGPGGRHNGYARLRPDCPRADPHGKPQKYESPVGGGNHAYFPPGTWPALSDPSVPLLITEGEKKSAKADQEGFPTVGLTGVWNWLKKGRLGPDGKRVGGDELIEDLEAVEWRGREVVLVFDSDVADKPDARQAERRLARQLADRGARVRLVRLAAGPGGAKVGLDDFLVAHGAEALRQLIRAAAPAGGGAWVPGPWPDLLLLSDRPDAPAFPLDTLPVQLGQFVREAAWAVNCPPDFFAVPLLTMAGGAAGNAVRLVIHDRHEQSACAWTYIVGDPGSAKSPALDQLQDPFVRAQVAHFRDWQEKDEAWAALDKKGRGPRPVLRRCLTDDTTAESLMATLDQNPRGVLMARDELAALVESMNQYKQGRGNDRQVYLKLWAHAPIIRDRKSDRDRPTFIIPRPFVAITGGVQPAVLARLRDGGGRGGPAPDDGFLDRFWGSYPEDLQAVGEEWRGVDAGARQAWGEAVRRLLALEMEDGRPKALTLTICGKRAWETFTRDHAAEVNDPSFPDWLKGPWAKFRGGCGRFALIVHLLRRACDAPDPEGAPFTAGDAVDGESVTRAARLVEYFKGHARKILAAADADPRLAVARRLLRWFPTLEAGRFSRRDAYRAARGRGCDRVEDIDPVLNLLQQHAYIRPLAAPDADGAGRKPSPGYEVHPQVLGHFGQNGQKSAPARDSVHSVHSVQGSGNGVAPGPPPREPGEGDDWIGEVK